MEENRQTMPSSQESARKGQSPVATPNAGPVATNSGGSPARGAAGDNPLLDDILKWLDEAKAESIVAIDIKEKSSIGDWMIVASGRNDRHVGAIADQLQHQLKEAGVQGLRVEGMQTCDWVVVDVGATIVHIFRPEVRTFYNLEKMWSGDRPAEAATH